MAKKLVHFGAGNIGRSFIGQLFSRSGWEVVFIDINDTLVEALNQKRRYRVIIKRNDVPDEELRVERVRAVHGKDKEQVAEEIASADLVSTSVGKSALPHILPLFAEVLKLRREKTPDDRLDLIIAENIRDGAAFIRNGLQKLLPADYPLDDRLGLVETSIGKMVPIMREEDMREDPLWVFAEEYNSLILDKHGFKTGIPDVKGIHPVNNIVAYVDRKLFVHNLGHAATAYLGYAHDDTYRYIWEPLQEHRLYEKSRACMEQAAVALNREYPEDLPMNELQEHIDDLLIRFQNKALGDTIFRVGRDLHRKLHKNDRLVGAMLLCEKHGLPYDRIAEAVTAAFDFRAADENGRLFPADAAFAEEDYPRGIDHILKNVCGLSEAVPLEGRVLEQIKNKNIFDKKE
jgi:mannitol-1-phosphate 5-dehydrogenase